MESSIAKEIAHIEEISMARHDSARVGDPGSRHRTGAKAIFNSRYNAEITAIKAKGEPITPADLIGKPIPDADNGAVVYERVFTLMDSGKYDAPQKALEEFAYSGSPDPQLLTKARQAFTQIRPVLDMVEEAASRPRCRFPMNPSDFALPPENARLRSIARLILATTKLCEREGRTDDAVRYARLGFMHADSRKDRPTIMDVLVREAILQIASSAMRDAFRQVNVSEQQSKGVFDVLANIDMDAQYIIALQGERIILLEQAASMPGWSLVQDSLPKSISDNVIGTAVSRVAGLAYDEACPRGDRADWLRFMATQIEGVRLSYKEARSRGLFHNRSAWPVYAMLSEMCGSHLGTLQFRRFEAKSRMITCDQVLLALLAYKARFGGYPSSIQELKSKLGWKLPVDPFTGKDFIYKKQTKGFILYSVGPDMNDDGGQPIQGNLVELESKGDIVLRWNR